MQKIIAKYGLAAHLAFLAVAPLFLFPFVGGEALVPVALWLSLVAAVWVVMDPSVRQDERLHEARRRVLGGIFRDPLFWMLVVCVVFSGIRAFNTGVDLCYNAEAREWELTTAAFPMFPGSVHDAGRFPFVASVAILVLVQGCRHALGGSARTSFLLIASVLAGLAAVIAVVAASFGVPGARAALEPDAAVCTFAGMAFSMYLLVGAVVLAAMFERKWNALIPLSFLTIGGTAAGGFAFAPAIVFVPFAIAGIAVCAYSFFFLFRKLNGFCAYRYLAVLGMALAIGVCVVIFLVPSDILMAKLSFCEARSLLKEGFSQARDILSGIARRSWMDHPWFGTGIGSFPLTVRFMAQEGDWSCISQGVSQVPNGWWQLLLERGFVGAFLAILPVFFLVVVYARRLIAGLRGGVLFHPMCWIAPVASLTAGFIGLFDCSFLRFDASVVLIALFVISARSFPKLKR